MYIAGLEDGKMMYDASIYKTVLARCPVLSVLADNPRASEFEHHLGSSAKKFCRKCNVRGQTWSEYGITVLL